VKEALKHQVVTEADKRHAQKPAYIYERARELLDVCLWKFRELHSPGKSFALHFTKKIYTFE